MHALSATRQGGSIIWSPAEAQAGFWMGTTASWTALATGDQDTVGRVSGMDDIQQVGGGYFAGLWRSTPESFANLHPSTMVRSIATAVRNNMQVGGVVTQSWFPRAAMWRGTPESYVDLQPMGATQSRCTATDGVLQGGSVNWGWPSSVTHATIWSGTAQSFVTLTPPSHSYSCVWGMAPGVQVGEVDVISGGVGAALWHGTAQSFVDLNPPGRNTRLFGTTGRIHVGLGRVGKAASSHALVNFGSANSWLDLHQFLSGERFPGTSAALAVYQDGNTIYVGGYAVNTGGYNEAILWIGTVACFANCDQSTRIPALTANDFQCFLNAFAAGDGAANCDHSTTAPTLNGNDFQCFLNAFAAGCS